MLGLKQQLVSSWGSDGLDEQKLNTKVIIFDSIAITILIMMMTMTMRMIMMKRRKNSSAQISYCEELLSALSLVHPGIKSELLFTLSSSSSSSSSS